MVLPLLCLGVMVDAIFRLTVLTVALLAAVNAAQTAALLFRLVRHIARRRPGYGYRLWLPIFTSLRDVREWLHAWHGVLRPDPALVAIRTDAKQVMHRHIYLAVLSQAWAMAVSAIGPALV